MNKGNYLYDPLERKTKSIPEVKAGSTASVILFILGGIICFVGILIIGSAKGAIQEIGGFVLLLISTVLFVGGIINNSIKSSTKLLCIRLKNK